MKPRPAGDNSEVLPNLLRRATDIGKNDDMGNKADNDSYVYFATKKYKLKHCEYILCHNLRRRHEIHLKGFENPKETLGMDDHVKIKLLYVVNER
jgi:uncharacterized protein (UPF0276 family)